MSNETTTRAPADVREQVAKEVYVCEHVRRGAEESWARQRWQTETDGVRDLYFETADRILALLRTPRGEGDVKPLAWRVEYRGRTGGEWEYLNTYDLVEVAKEKVERMRRGGVRLEYRIVPLYPAAFRSEAQGGEADALDLIRWAEARAVALEPVAGNIMPPGTYACYAGDGDDPYMGPGILGAIRAARRGEEQGQERWEDLVFGPIVEAYNEAHDASRSEGGSNGLE